MANDLKKIVLTPANGSYVFTVTSLLYKTIIKVTRENQVLFPSVTVPVGTDPFYSYTTRGVIRVSSLLRFNGSEKLTVIYKDLI